MPEDISDQLKKKITSVAKTLLEQFVGEFTQAGKDVASLPGDKILVHGGGKIATQIAEKLGVQTVMVEGGNYDVPRPVANQTRYYRVRAVSTSNSVSNWSVILTVDATLFAFEDVMALLAPILN